MGDFTAEFLRHNDWANARLIDFCETLEEDALDATAAGTYGRVGETLIHMISSLQRYHLRLAGRPVEPSGPVSEGLPWPGFAELKRAARGFGAGLLDIAEQAPDELQAQGHWDDKDWSIAGAMLLVQAVNHSADHRSQIATILSQTGIQAPDLDAWAWGEATGRLRESAS